MLVNDHLCPPPSTANSTAARLPCRESSRPARRGLGRSGRQGFTLLEVMIATAVTLLMMLSLAQIFKVIGDSMKQGRAVLELNNRLRSVVYRLRTDLDRLTAFPEPPADPSTATGYLQIFDGSLTDFSTSNISLAHSRFGDVDDIFMATIRAGDVWFTGKVPAYILAQRAPNSAADIQMVTIASQYAEVAVFAQPAPGTSTSGTNFKDSDGLSGFPDSFRLHYRTLLIRPDLNLSTGLLPGGTFGPESWTICRPEGNGLPSPLSDMAKAHQQCDLSIRRVFDPSTPATGIDPVAANSLEDLVDPANRFAHVQVPISGTRSTTMPLLALDVALGVTTAIVDTTTTPNAQYNNAFEPTGGGSIQVGSGFLHPAFVLRGDRTGEDLLGSDILAFDIKVFDPGVPLLASPGPDRVDELGAAGTDDVVLSPNDPGYAAALTSGVSAVGTGEYVDLAWARKLVAHSLNPASAINASTNVWSPFSGFSQANFSPAVPINSYTDGLYKSGYILRVGNGPVPLVLQPCFDTWTSRYEGDGVLQAQLIGEAGVIRIDGALNLYGIGSGTDAGNIYPPWKNNGGVPVIDAATDGLDNNPPPGPLTGLGIDDASELETSPPYPTPLRGIKISVRMEDPLTRQIKQMSAGKEFVSQQ
jgi:prepilin-type N-terminal cleavage/methylation domain-containing protein